MYIFENYGSNYGSKRSETNRSNPIRAERNSVTTPKTVCVLRWALTSHGRGHWFNPGRAHHFINDLRFLLGEKVRLWDKIVGQI